MKLLNLIGKTLPLLAALILGAAVQSCDLIYDGEAGECPYVNPDIDPTVLGDNRTLKLNITYYYNMKFANAFAHEVTSVNVFVFDKSGNLLYTVTDSGSALQEEPYSLKLLALPGTYDIVCWGGLEGNDNFDLTQASTKEEFLCKLNRNSGSDGAYVDENLSPLFYGTIEDVTVGDAYEVYEYDLDLMKDTNNIRIMLQQLNGESLNVDDFVFELTDANGYLNWDNSLLDDETITYKPYSTYTGTVETETKASSTFYFGLAEFTTSRLVKGQDMRLTVSRASDGEVVFSIPVIDYALAVKGNYRASMGDQEYLDRQDEYVMTFFLSEGEKWMSSYIYVNEWKVVLNDVDF